MKLSEETKTKMRKLIEDEFRNVPEGIKVKLDNEMMDELIFYYGGLKESVDSNYNKFKVPIWTPDCLSKIDLSELSFKNIWIDAGGESDEEILDYETEKFYNENGFPYVLDWQERKLYPNMAFVNFKNTNINIDFRDAISGKTMRYWNLSGVDLSQSHIDILSTIELCDLSNTNINLDNVDWFTKPSLEAAFHNDNIDDPCMIVSCNLSGNDLSKVKFNIENLDYNNFANTGLRMQYSAGKTDEEVEKRLRESLKDGNIVGCYLNDTLIKENDTLEDILNRTKSQEQELLNNISNEIRSQLAAYSNNSIVNNDEIAISDDENKKHI